MGTHTWIVAGALAGVALLWITPAALLAWAIARAGKRYERARREDPQAANDQDLLEAYRAGFEDAIRTDPRAPEEMVKESQHPMAAIALPSDPVLAYKLLMRLALELVDMAEELAPAASGNGESSPADE